MAAKNKIKTEWDLTLLYTSAKDPKIERDVTAIEGECEMFAEKWRDVSIYVGNSAQLKLALEAFENVNAQVLSAKPLMYFHYRKALNTQEGESQMNKLTMRITAAHNAIIFFPLALGVLSLADQKKLLGDLALKKFHYFLKVLFKESAHHLSVPEEKIMSLKSLPAHNLWIQAQEKILYSNQVELRGKKVPLAEAQFTLQNLPTKGRRALGAALVSVYKSVAPIAEAEINALYTDKKINDELRKFKEPFSASILDYQNDEKTVLSLVESVTKASHISHRFYAVKAKLLKLDKLNYFDRSAAIGTVKQKFPFEKAVEIVRAGFNKAHPNFSTIFDSFLERGQIDAMPKKGKEGGAFCASGSNQPTFVMLNHVGSMDSVMTLAHEMGHAIHSEYSKGQTPLYEHYTMPVAETASTLFENFAFDELEPLFTKKEKIIALHNQIQDGISTIFRQIGCFNFELELHRAIREKGALSHAEMAALHNKNMLHYLGPKFKLSPEEGYFFVSWSHIRRFFYVYSYAYGELVSKVLYRRWKKDPTYIEKIIAFLSAGGSRSPEEIFLAAGVDTRHTDYIREGLAEIESKIIELEKLA